MIHHPQSRKVLLLSLLFVIIFLLYFTPITASDLASNRISLLTLHITLGGRLLQWNISDDTPCNWTGITCRAHRVVELRLPGMGLSGPIPPEIGNLTSLRNLYFQDNFFAGEIPKILFNLQNLVTLNLANNNFAGLISPDFNKLTKLVTLNLEGNQLNGSIPELNLRSLDQFNVSFNKFIGPIPEKLSSKPASSFEGNSLCGKPLSICNATSNSIGDNNNLSSGGIAVILIGCFTGCLCKKKRIKQREEAEGVARSEGAAAKAESKGFVLFGDTPEVFSLDDLLKASAEILGKGSYGTAYKATLESGSPLVVKRWNDVKVSKKKFREAFDVVGKINHENLLPLRAYRCDKDEKFLVYDYMPMGSLYALLQGNRDAGNRKKTPLNWDTRFGIALGVARAIEHIHSQGPVTSHGNIKSSNILLTTTLEALVSNFLLNHIVEPNPYHPRVDGYCAPEVTDSRRKVSQKADVYSFGVLLLELLTGKTSIVKDELTSEDVNLPRWILSVVENELTSEDFELDLLQYENVEELLVRMLQVAINCATQDPYNRPSMADVVSQIEEFSCCSSQVHETHIDVEDYKSHLLPCS